MFIVKIQIQNNIGDKMAKIRLDRFLSNCGAATRSQAKKLIRQKRVSVGGITVTDESMKVDDDCTDIMLDNKKLVLEKYVYIMLNKPRGVISATDDKTHKTVTDIIKEEHKGLFPAGRLDIDTEGLIILTNDGDFAHKTLSPKNHVTKKYIACVSGLSYSKELAENFAQGITADDGTTFRPAILCLIEENQDNTVFSVEITEGKFHQVKKMFAAFGGKVITLKRISFGEIVLDETLPTGRYRRLNEKEMKYVNTIKNNRIFMEGI